MSVDGMEMPEMDAWQDGLYLEVDAVNSEQRRKPSERRVLMHWMRRSEVRGKRFGED